MATLNETVTRTDPNPIGSIAIKLMQLRDDQQARRYPLLALDRIDGRILARRLKNELQFQWNGGQQDQEAQFQKSGNGTTIEEIGNDLVLILSNEFTEARGCGSTEEERKQYFSQHLKLDYGGNSVVLLCSDKLKMAFLVTQHDADEAEALVSDVEQFMCNIASDNNAHPTEEFLGHYFDALATEGDVDNYHQSINGSISYGPMVNNTHQLFREWWTGIELVMSTLSPSERAHLKDKLEQLGFQVESHGQAEDLKVVGHQVGNQAAPAAAQPEQQNTPAEQQNTPAEPQQAAPEVEYEILASQGFSEYNPGWYSSQRVYIMGKMPYEEFQQWWQNAGRGLREALMGNKNTLRYMQFKGVVDESDSTVKNTILVALDPGDKDIRIYGNINLPKKRKPSYKVVYSFHVGPREFLPFVRLADGKWHGHLYSMRNNEINNSQYGMRILHDPDGYLNALYAVRPNGLTLHDVGPGVPQTIGNNVTHDLTQGIPRTQLQPLTQQQQEAANRQIEQMRQAEQSRRSRERQAIAQVKEKSSTLQQLVPDVFKAPALAKVISYWPGDKVPDYKPNSKDRIFHNPNEEHVIINFPGSISHEIVGEDDIMATAAQLGIDDDMRPIIELIRQNFPEATPLLKFGGKVR